MSWGTDFKADIYLSRQAFSSIVMIEDRLEEYDDDIKDIESKIKMYASSTPKDITPEDNDPVNYIENEVSDLLVEYADIIVDRFKLSLYLEEVKENPEILKKVDWFLPSETEGEE